VQAPLAGYDDDIAWVLRGQQITASPDVAAGGSPGTLGLGNSGIGGRSAVAEIAAFCEVR
jgi:hypothetical protein